eukprot:tig00000403_g331.t1
MEDDGSICSLFASEEREAIEEKSFSVAGVTVHVAAVPSHFQHGGATAIMLWPASSILNQFLAAAAEELRRSERMLELGAGVGLNAIVAAKLLPGVRVVATDGEEESVALIERNLRRNGVEAQCVARALRWGRPEARAFAAELAASASAPTFDHVVGSDLIYSPGSLYPLFDTVDELLAGRTPDPAPAPRVDAEKALYRESSLREAVAALRAGPCFVLAYTTRGVPDDEVPRAAAAAGFPACLRVPIDAASFEYSGNRRLTHLLVFPRAAPGLE